MDWLIVGAQGFLGSNFGSFVHSSNRGTPFERLHGVARTTRALHPAFSSHLVADVSEPGVVSAIIASTRPAVVINAAAMADHERCELWPDEAFLVNATAPAEIAQACNQYRSRFVHISTDAVFDGASGSYGEGDDPQPFSTYGRSKAQGERLVLEANPEAVILRTNFFGWSPTGSRSILEFFVSNLVKGTAVPGFTDFVVSTGFVLDIVETIIDLVVLGAQGCIHATSHDSMSKYAFGCLAAEVFGLDAELIVPTGATMGGYGNRGQRDLSLSNAYVESLLGRSMPTQREGLKKARTVRMQYE